MASAVVNSRPDVGRGAERPEAVLPTPAPSTVNVCVVKLELKLPPPADERGHRPRDRHVGQREAAHRAGHMRLPADRGELDRR